MQTQLQNMSFEMKQSLIGNFPNIKLCYDNMNHNKVDKLTTNIVFDICCAIPCGKKCFAWFTQLNDKNVCLILELIDRKNIHDIKIYNCIFNNELVYGKYGTILYGTLFHFKQASFFAVEDIFYCKGHDITCCNWMNKLTSLKKLFDNDIKQVSYNKNFLVFGLPLMSQDIDELKRMIDDVQYKIYNIQFRSFNKVNVIDSVLLKEIDSMVKTKPPIIAPVSLRMHDPIPKQEIILPKSVTKPLTKSNIVFKVKADIQNDIYHLYCNENNVELFYNVAYIPDYKTSVMMNTLFRNIKENENLDLLEESDDEEEFQNENIDRFVDINKSVLMICKFNYKFKKWYPVKEVITLKQNIVDKNELLDYEKNNYTQQQQQHHNKKHNQHQNKKQFYSNKPSYRK